MTELEKEELVASLAEEFLGRFRTGEAVTISSFTSEYPECAEELRELLPVMVDMEGLVRGTQPLAPVCAHYPDRLGDFRLLERIGSGGMGTVFRALQESLHREVAVKILAPLWNADARHREAFENESRVIAGLRHTNIVEVYGAGQEGDYRYYVMGLVRGHGVSAGRLGAIFPDMTYERAVAYVGLQAARALAFAHEHGVVHRDIKPGNMLLDSAGVLHVSDFGLATILNSGEDAPLVTQSHDGTLRYMAPERLMKGINSFAGDQYSLGVTLYELLTRRPVFRESAPGKLVHSIISNTLQPLRLRTELAAIVNKAIAFEASDRYPSMADMAVDLEYFLEDKPIMARPISRLRRYVLWLRRRPAVAIWSHVAALLVVALLVSISIGYARGQASLKKENEQRHLAELNAQIADASLQRIFSGMVTHGEADEDFLPPSRADARLIQDLMPYYEQLVTQENSGNEKVTRASTILATIALQTGDYPTAEKYYRRVSESSPIGSIEQAEAANGLAMAIYAQGDISRYEEANKLLMGQVNKVPAESPYDTRLELVRGLMLADRHSNWRALSSIRGEKGGGGSRSSRRRMNQVMAMNEHETMVGAHRVRLGERAACMLRNLLDEQPQNEKARLLQAELLQYNHSREVKRLMSPAGETPLALLEQLLVEQPHSEIYQRAYLRLVTAPRFRGHGKGLPRVDLALAVQYAQNLLASNPGDSESIMLFLSVRDRYAESLAHEGKTAEAERENERTLGVLSFLSSRADFTPELREKLILLVAMHPQLESGRSQQEDELRMLLQNYDAQRIKALQQRMQRMRIEMKRRRSLHHPGNHPPKPYHGSGHRNPLFTPSVGRGENER